MKAFKEMLKQLFVPGYTDKQVKAVHKDTLEKLQQVDKAADSYNKLLKKNGVTMQIVIAAGGEHHHGNH